MVNKGAQDITVMIGKSMSPDFEIVGNESFKCSSRKEDSKKSPQSTKTQKTNSQITSHSTKNKSHDLFLR